MALTRSFLKAMGLEDDKINSIIEAHTETTDALKKQRDEAKEMAGNAEGLTKEVESLKAQLEKAQQTGTDAAKVQAAFDAYKAQVETEAANRAKKETVRKLFKDNGVQREPFIDLLMGLVDLSKVELDNGKVKDEQAFIGDYKAKYGDLFSTKQTGGTPSFTPPSGSNPDYSSMSDEDYYKATFHKKE